MWGMGLAKSPRGLKVYPHDYSHGGSGPSGRQAERVCKGSAPSGHCPMNRLLVGVPSRGPSPRPVRPAGRASLLTGGPWLERVSFNGPPAPPLAPPTPCGCAGRIATDTAVAVSGSGDHHGSPASVGGAAVHGALLLPCSGPSTHGVTGDSCGAWDSLRVLGDSRSTPMIIVTGVLPFGPTSGACSCKGSAPSGHRPMNRLLVGVPSRGRVLGLACGAAPAS